MITSTTFLGKYTILPCELFLGYSCGPSLLWCIKRLKLGTKTQFEMTSKDCLFQNICMKSYYALVAVGIITDDSLQVGPVWCPSLYLPHIVFLLAIRNRARRSRQCVARGFTLLCKGSSSFRSTWVKESSMTDSFEVCVAYNKCKRHLGIFSYEYINDTGTTCKRHTGRPTTESNPWPLNCEADVPTSRSPSRPATQK